LADWMCIGFEADAHRRRRGTPLALRFAVAQRRSTELSAERSAYGLASRSLVLGAIGAGFRFLSGPAIHADVSSPAKAVRFDPLDLYRDLVGHGPMVGLSR